MATDLFGGVSQPSPSARTRSRTVVVISVGAHAVVIVGALFLSLSSPGMLPVPREALAFVDHRPDVRMVDIELAPSRPVATPAASSAPSVATTTPAAPANAAPVVAPMGIPPETGLESAPTVARPTELSRIESGPGLASEFNISRIEKPAAPAAAPQTPVRLHSGIREPVKIVNVEPIYPALAQSARVQGVVILEVVIGVSGRVESVQVLKSIPLLDAAALAAVRQWQYRPAMLNESPIPVVMTVTVKFTL